MVFAGSSIFSVIFFCKSVGFTSTFFCVTDCMEWIIWNGLSELPAGLYDLSFDKK